MIGFSRQYKYPRLFLLPAGQMLLSIKQETLFSGFKAPTKMSDLPDRISKLAVDAGDEFEQCFGSGRP